MEALNFQQNLPDILGAWHALKAKKIKQRPQNQLRASSIGFACDRYHYHSIKDWREKSLHDPVMQSIFDEGNLHEKDVIQALIEMGFEIIEQQRSFQLDKPLITGHIDGILIWENQRFPFDVKTINPYDFKKIDCVEDILYSKKAHQRNYAAQLQMYLLLMGEETGLFILKNKLTGELKPIWMQIDYDFAEQVLKRAERVYAALEKEAPPDRTYDMGLCHSCAFKHICLPDLKFGDGVQAVDDFELASLLDRRSQLEEAYQSYREIDEQVKETARSLGEGEKICGDYLIKVKEITGKKKVALTWDEKEYSYLRTDIVKLKDEADH